MKRQIQLFACCVLALASTQGIAWAGELPIELRSVANEPWTYSNLNGYEILNGDTYPVGLQNFGGIQFVIPNGPNNYWGAAPADNFGSDAVSVTIPVGVYGVTSAFTLMNTAWGQPGPNAYLTITFTFSSGTTRTVPLYGNDNVRDYNNDGYTNSVNNYSTVQAWQNGLGQRLDRQEYVLPPSYATQTLESVTITDTGGEFFSRAILAALTVSTCPAYVTEGVQTSGGPIVYDPRLNVYEQEVKFTNAGRSAVHGPLFFMLEGLPDGVGVVNASSVSTCFAPIGSPYAIVLKPGESLAPGTSLVFKLAFRDVNGAAITYTPLTLGSLGGKP